jgi:hypothetical protein
LKSILNISKKIDIGSRFNNFALRAEFKKFGWQACFASWTPPKEFSDEIFSVETRLNRIITNGKSSLSRLTGNVDGYYSNAIFFKKLKAYQEADLLHFHIIHESYLSLKDWEVLSHDKPVVWTWHDPYPMHGHCLHSFDCDRYKEGCIKCPHLDYHFEILRDRSSKNLIERVEMVKKIDPLVIVASKWMLERVRESKFRDDIRVELLPFGVTYPMSNETTSEARKRLKIPVDNIVIGFRADYSMYKGLDLILFALNKLASEFGDMPITIITFQEKNTLKTVEDKFQVIDLGWVGGEDVHKYYPAMNFFLMPSKAEAFGLMAVEAMMHGVFPLVTHGTALESLLMDPEHSLVSLHDAESYFDLIVKALLNYKYYSKLKKDELQGWALKEYSSMKFIEKLSKIYTQEYARFHHF